MTDISVEWRLNLGLEQAATRAFSAGRRGRCRGGLGPARRGVAAATIAAEAGARVLVIEKYGFAGGAAVAGLSGTICGMYLASEDARHPEQVVHGFTERFAADLPPRAVA